MDVLHYLFWFCLESTNLLFCWYAFSLWGKRHGYSLSFLHGISFVFWLAEAGQVIGNLMAEAGQVIGSLEVEPYVILRMISAASAQAFDDMVPRKSAVDMSSLRIQYESNKGSLKQKVITEHIITVLNFVTLGKLPSTRLRWLVPLIVQSQMTIS